MEVKLKIPQLTLGQIAQSGIRQDGSQWVPGSIPTKGTFLLKLLCSSFIDNVAIFVYYGKTRKRSELNTGLGSQSEVGAVDAVRSAHPGLYTKILFNAV